MCEEAPGLVIEKRRLIDVIGGTFLGIIGDANHSFGFHLCSPPSGDYSREGTANQPLGDYACALDVGMNWPASRQWLTWLITEIREDRITGIAEVIGSFDGKNVRYWSDSETPEWQQNGVTYTGTGHDTWTHVAIYRSTAKQDHKILAGWTANGLQGGTAMGDYTPLWAPEAVKINGVVRGDSVMLADLWNQEQRGVSPYDGKSPSVRTAQLGRIEATAKAAQAEASGARADIAKLAVSPVDVTALANALGPALKPIIVEAVRAELAKLTLKAVQ